MIIRWMGHSCFLLKDSRGTRILTDPCDPETGYPITPMEVDGVTSSHDHHDHNYFELALGEDVQRITGPGKRQVKGVEIEGFSTWHDGEQGAKRGENTLFIIEMDGIRILHAGDLGHIPDGDTLSRIGRVDVAMLPIGGIYTIDYRQALQLVDILRPRVVIPMHYQTERLKFHLEELAPFLDNALGWAIHRMRQSEAEINPDSLGNARIVVLQHDRKAV